MTNLGTLRSRFTRIFLRSLSKLNRRVRPLSSSSPRRRSLTRHRSIRIAAYASMASAVGMRRAWSRAVLRRIRRGHHRDRLWKKIKDGRRKRNDNEGGGVRGARKKLRRLVPGGEGMEFHRLLAETADYIKCLRTQVEAMRSIADYYTPI